jgi:hypothetical protein
MGTQSNGLLDRIDHHGRAARREPEDGIGRKKAQKAQEVFIGLRVAPQAARFG